MQKFTIYGNPITKKNSQRIITLRNHPAIIPSKQYKDYEKLAGKYIQCREPINEPCNIKCTYYMQTRRKVDLTNLLEATHDILVKYQVIADDNSNIVKSVDGSRVLYDKDNPRVEIEIEVENVNIT